MEKGRPRRPGPLAWESGRAAEGDCDVAASRQAWQTTQKLVLRISAAAEVLFPETLLGTEVSARG